jgi:hypothetical protein
LHLDHCRHNAATEVLIGAAQSVGPMLTIIQPIVFGRQHRGEFLPLVFNF